MIFKIILFIFSFNFLAYSQNVFFSDQTKEQNINFKHYNGETGEKFYTESVGAGCCVLDYNNDGYVDIFFVQGNSHKSKIESMETSNILFQNNNKDFINVTDDAGLINYDYGIGCAIADYNNDGFDDIFVSNYGTDILYKNLGNGKFKDVTEISGIKNNLWSSSATFFDYDKDGFLDLYITNYVDFNINQNPWCGDEKNNKRRYCDPDVFEGLPDVLYKNNGDGTFLDVSNISNISKSAGKGLGVVTSDFDNDNDLDIYVANDKVMNHMFINNGDGTFIEEGLFLGVGFNENGKAEAGMGVDVGDYNSDGWFDLFVTNFSGESNTLYKNEKNGFFSDVTFATGLGQPSLDLLSWGTKFIDLDLDGDLDIFTVNGHINENVKYFSSNYFYKQPKQIFINLGDGKFVDNSKKYGLVIGKKEVSRGAAFADIDNDGDSDIIISNNNSFATLIINENKNKNNWIGLILEGKSINKDAIGAKIKVNSETKNQYFFVNPGSSYLSSNDKRVQIGLGLDSKINYIEINWLNNKEPEIFINFDLNNYYKLTEGGKKEKILIK